MMFVSVWNSQNQDCKRRCTCLLGVPPHPFHPTRHIHFRPPYRFYDFNTNTKLIGFEFIPGALGPLDLLNTYFWVAWVFWIIILTWVPEAIDPLDFLIFNYEYHRHPTPPSPPAPPSPTRTSTLTRTMTSPIAMLHPLDQHQRIGSARSPYIWLLIAYNGCLLMFESWYDCSIHVFWLLRMNIMG